MSKATSWLEMMITQDFQKSPLTSVILAEMLEHTFLMKAANLLRHRTALTHIYITLSMLQYLRVNYKQLSTMSPPTNFLLTWERFVLRCCLSFLYFILFLINLFIYLFLAALGLRCYAWAFLKLQRVGAALCCGAGSSHCGGFSCCRARALSVRASGVVARWP